MQLNRLYRRAIQYLTKNNEEKKELQRQVSTFSMHERYFREQEYNYLREINNLSKENLYLNNKIKELKNKQKFIDAKVVLKEFVEEIKNIRS